MIFGFHKNQCKMQLIYGNVTQSCYIIFQNQIHLFAGYPQFFHFMMFMLTKIVYNGVHKLRGKHVSRKIKIIHV